MAAESRDAEQAEGDACVVDAILDASDGASVVPGVGGKRDPAFGGDRLLQLDGLGVGIRPGAELRRQAEDETHAREFAVLDEASTDHALKGEASPGHGLQAEQRDDVAGAQPAFGHGVDLLFPQSLDESGRVEALHLLFGVNTLRSEVQTQREPTRWTSQTFQSLPSTQPAAKPEPQREVARRCDA